MASNEYDKLKEMYRLQGQEEQGRRFREMTGAPDTDDDLRARLGLSDASPSGPTSDGLQDMSRRLERDRLVEAKNQAMDQYLYARDDLKSADARVAKALGGDHVSVLGRSAKDAVGLVRELHKRGLITATTPELQQALAEIQSRKDELTRADSAADQAYRRMNPEATVIPYRAGEEPKK